MSFSSRNNETMKDDDDDNNNDAFATLPPSLVEARTTIVNELLFGDSVGEGMTDDFSSGVGGDMDQTQLNPYQQQEQPKICKKDEPSPVYNSSNGNGFVNHFDHQTMEDHKNVVKNDYIDKNNNYSRKDLDQTKDVTDVKEKPRIIYQKTTNANTDYSENKDGESNKNENENKNNDDVDDDNFDENAAVPPNLVAARTKIIQQLVINDANEGEYDNDQQLMRKEKQGLNSIDIDTSDDDGDDDDSVQDSKPPAVDHPLVAVRRPPSLVKQRSNMDHAVKRIPSTARAPQTSQPQQELFSQDEGKVPSDDSVEIVFTHDQSSNASVNSNSNSNSSSSILGPLPESLTPPATVSATNNYEQGCENMDSASSTRHGMGYASIPYARRSSKEVGAYCIRGVDYRGSMDSQAIQNILGKSDFSTGFDMSSYIESQDLSAGTDEFRSTTPGAYQGVGIPIGSSYRNSFHLQNHRQTSSLHMHATPSIEMTTIEPEDTLLTAFKVEDVEETVRKRILETAVSAQVVVDPPTPPEDDNNNGFKRYALAGLCVFVIVLIVVAVAVVSVTSASKPSVIVLQSTAAPTTSPITSPTLPPSSSGTGDKNISTLKRVKEKGILTCRSDTIERDFVGSDRLSVDLCRAVAAAIFDGDSERFELSTLRWSQQWLGLADGTLDVVTASVTYTMERDVYKDSAMAGFSFSSPFSYSAQAFAGVPTYVDCADRFDTFLGDCADMVICLIEGTTAQSLVLELMPGVTSYTVESGEHGSMEFTNGNCNVLADEIFLLNAGRVRELGYEGEYKIGSNSFSVEPLVLMTRVDDPEWTRFVYWILQSLFEAENLGITKETAQDFPYTSNGLFGDEYNDMFQNAIAGVGNYGHLYEKSLQAVFPRAGSNLLYRFGEDSTGLLTSHPFGSIDRDGPSPVPGQRLDDINTRGKLLCGLRTTNNRLGLAQYNNEVQQWEGLEIDLCRAIASAVFREDEVDEFLQYVDFSDPVNNIGYDEIDVLAGLTISLENNIKDPLSNIGWTFSSPYYFGAERRDVFALATSPNDSQWSDFVQWILISLLFAEEEQINDTNPTEMPVTRSFGNNFLQMFRYAVATVGNYGQVYERNVEPYNPRSGRNLLNSVPFGPQLTSMPFV